MARTLPDLMALLATMSGPDARQPLSLAHDPTLTPAQLHRDPSHLRGVRIGWLGDLGGHLATEPGVLELCEQALLDVRGLGCSVEAAPLGFDAESIWTTFGVLRSLANRARFDAYRADPQQWAQIKPESQWEYEQGAKHSGMDVHRALVNRSAWFQRTLALFEQFDFLVQPSAQCFPFPVTQHWPAELGGRTMDSYHRWMEGMALATLAGLPAISVPAGFDSRGLPMGLQLIGRPGADLAVLQLAQAYDVATGWVSRHPPALLAQV
jgi:amidase